MAFVPGGDLSVGRLAWVNRVSRGSVVEFLNADERIYGPVDLTPDNRQLAVQVAGVQDYIAIVDVARGTSVRINSAVSEGLPVWSADGQRLATYDLDHGRTLVRRAASNGVVGESKAVDSSDYHLVTWSSRGDVLAIGNYATVRIKFVGIDHALQLPEGVRDPA
jgi:hypothetical protein